MLYIVACTDFHRAFGPLGDKRSALMLALALTQAQKRCIYVMIPLESPDATLKELGAVQVEYEPKEDAALHRPGVYL